MPQQFIFGRTHVERTPLGKGFYQADYSPFLRSRYKCDLPRFQQSPIADITKRQKGQIIDRIPGDVIERASKFQYRQKATDTPSGRERDSAYLLRLTFFWWRNDLQLDLADDKTKNCVRFVENKTDFDALEIQNKKTMFESLLDKFRPYESNEEEWEGFRYNLWPLFKVDHRTGIGIDDSLDPIEGLYITPSGIFSMRYKYRRPLMGERLENSIGALAFIYGTSSLEYRIT